MNDNLKQRLATGGRAIGGWVTLAHPAIVSVIPGPNHPDQVRTNVQWMARAIPDALWAELKRERLIRTDAPCPPRDRA